MADETNEFAGPDLPSWLTGNLFASITPNPPAPDFAKATALAPPPPPAVGPGLSQSPDVMAVKHRMWGEESGGRQFNSDGTTVTSPMGALGFAQVMPGTGPEAARLAGLPWDEERLKTDTEYNKALGNAYYDQQLKTFGDPLKAAAAYNAGPGAVSSALQQEKETGKSWLSFLPDETKNYVAVVSGQKPSGGQTSSQGAISQNSPGQPGVPAMQSMDLKGMLQLALLQAALPRHKFVPIDYDPFKVRPVVGGPVQ